MKNKVELIKWWTSLTIKDKEAISGKQYPECSVWWNSLTQERQSSICEDSGIIRGPRNKSQGLT